MIKAASPRSDELNEIFHDTLKRTHLPLNKMAAILATNIFKCIFLSENDRIPIQISLNFVPDGPIDNYPAVV